MDPVELKNQLRVLRKINNFTRDIAENSTQAIVVVNANTHKISSSLFLLFVYFILFFENQTYFGLMEGHNLCLANWLAT
jgi:hypothetical protein